MTFPQTCQISNDQFTAQLICQLDQNECNHNGQLDVHYSRNFVEYKKVDYEIWYRYY